MAKIVDLLDSANQKFDPGASGMSSTNAQDGIIEAYSIVNVQFDLTPTLGGDLDLDGNNILITNPTDGLEGAIGLAQNNIDVFFAHINADGVYNPVDGGILCQPGVLELGGSVISIPSLKGGIEPMDVQVTEDGILYAAPLPQPGWEVSDTSTFNHSFGNGSTTGPWVEVQDLEVLFGDNVTTGDRVDVYVKLYVENTEDKTGTIEIGVGINGATPTTVGANKSVGPDSITYIPVSWSFIAASDFTTADRIDVFARRGASVDDATLHLRGSTSPHSMIASIPGSGGGGGGSPTNLGNIPGPSSVTVTSSTGSNTVLAAAVSGTAGVMTGAQVDELVGKADLASVNSFTAGNQFLGDFDVGDPGTETGSILLDGVSYPSVGKFNRFGTGNTAEVVIHRHSTTDGSNLVFSRALSNDATHANVVNGTALGDVQFSGWGDSSYWTGAIMRAVVDGTPGVSDMPTKLDFLTSADGSFTPTLRMSIRADGTVEVVGDMSVGGATITATKIANWDAASTFIGLTDTPGSYAGQAGLFARVNVTEDGLEFVAGGGGGIPEAPDDSFGYLREGPASSIWVRGSRVFEQPTAPSSPAIGDVWIDTT